MTLPAFRRLGYSTYETVIFGKKLRVWKASYGSPGAWIYVWEGAPRSAPLVYYPTKRAAIQNALEEA